MNDGGVLQPDSSDPPPAALSTSVKTAHMGSLQLTTENPTTRPRFKEGIVHDHVGSTGESHGTTGPHMELSWKFQLLSSANKCVKSSQRSRGSGKQCRDGGTHSTGSKTFREIQMSQYVHSPLADGSPGSPQLCSLPSRKLKKPGVDRVVHFSLGLTSLSGCACESMTFLIGIELFFSWKENR